MRTPTLLSLLSLLACGAPADTAPSTTPDANDRPKVLRDGFHVLRDGQGRPNMEGEIKDGERVGVWTAYGANGRVVSRNAYENGLLQGPTTTFREDGTVYYQGQHHADTKVGRWKFYDPAGKLLREAMFDSSGTEVPLP